MIFAAGLGTRLKPFTDSHPKALAEVCGRPLLGLVIGKLKAAGVDQFVINIHHFGRQICDYLAQNDDFGVRIDISDESDRLLDTGGGILAARRWLDDGDDFVVHNADILTDFDIKAMTAFHRDSLSDVSLLGAQRKTKRYLVFGRVDHVMHGWTNIETGETRPAGLEVTDGQQLLAFGGVHVLSPGIFPSLERYARTIGEGREIPKFSIIDFYIASCDHLKISAYCPPLPYRWHDIGKPESLASAEKDFAQTIKM